MKIAVVGATGLVGGVMLQVLQERGFSEHDILVAASSRSVGRQIMFAGRSLTVLSVEEAIRQQPDYAIFSAGAEVSRRYAPLFAQQGTVVIDNSSAWRKDSNIPLVVPEINIDVVRNSDRIIANPNCSTVQLALVLSRLHQQYRIRRIVVSTYQSVTGTGMKAVRQLEAEEKGQPVDDPAYPYPIHRNLFPHGGDFLTDGYTTEEQKLVDETRKILQSPDIAISATVARVPVLGGHSESVNVEFCRNFDLKILTQQIADTPGVVVLDHAQDNRYPMPIIAQGRDEVFVGRIRRDPSQSNTVNLWIVADNLRKGAATNAIQIMQCLMAKK